MKKTPIAIILCLIFILCTSCVKEPGNKKDDEEIVDPPIIDNPITELTDEEIYQKLFSLDSKITIYIDITNQELQLIEDDYQKYSKMNSKSPIYRKCNLQIDIDEYSYKIEEVGIRMKGNTSRTSFYNSTEGIYNLIHYKLSFSETFDDEEYYEEPKTWTSQARKERKNRTFATLEKLDIKANKTYDKTHVREIFAYDFYREMGLYSPHANLCNIKINNLGKKENLGVFVLIEPLDKIFISRYIENEVSDLYKVGWGMLDDGSWQGGNLHIDTINSIGVEDEDKVYFPIYDLKTNKKTSTHQALKLLINNLNNNSLLNVNIEYFLKFMAISYLLGNPDDYRAHYNNYYIYFSDNKAIFFPYDYDRCLGLTYGWNPMKGMSEVDPLSLYTTELGENINPLVKIILNNNTYKEQYITYLQEYETHTFFSYDNFKSYYEKASKHYNSLCKPSIKKINDEYVDFQIVESMSNNKNDENYNIYNYLDKIKNICNKIK